MHEEHEGMTLSEREQLADERLERREPIGRILSSMEDDGADTSGYQSSRTNDDLVRDVAWGVHTGKDKSKQLDEIRRRLA